MKLCNLDNAKSTVDNETHVERNETENMFLVNDVTIFEDTHEDMNCNVLAVDAHSTKRAKEWIAPVVIGSQIIPMKVDCGAQANLLSLRDYKKVKHVVKLKVAKSNLLDYNNETIDILGTCIVNIKCNGKLLKAMFSVVNDEDKQTLLGLDTSEKLGLIERAPTVKCVYVISQKKESEQVKREILQEYGELFHGLGQFSGLYHIKLNPNVKPVVHAPRKIPVALKVRLKKELNRMCCGIGTIHMPPSGKA